VAPLICPPRWKGLTLIHAIYTTATPVRMNHTCV
jgi:hypothetical protein